MYIDRTRITDLKQDSAIKRLTSNQNAVVLKELIKIFSVTIDHFSRSQVEKTSNWMLFKDTWLQNESGDLKITTVYRNYVRGDIISTVDWGTSNIGTEIRYPHPCVVLYDNGEDWIIGAPITQATFNTAGNLVLHQFDVFAAKQPVKPTDPATPKEYWFKKESVIQIDQIKQISKYRILNKTSFKLRTELLNQIDNLFLENFTPKKYALLEDLKKIVIDQKKENADLVNELLEEKQKNEAFHVENLQIKEELEKLKKIKGLD